MLDDPNRPEWKKDFFTGVPAPAGALTSLLPLYLSFLGVPAGAAFAPLAVKALPEALKTFRRRYGDLPISVRTLHSNDIARAMLLQEGDVGIVYGRLSHPALSDELVATGEVSDRP